MCKCPFCVDEANRPPFLVRLPINAIVAYWSTLNEIHSDGSFTVSLALGNRVLRVRTASDLLEAVTTYESGLSYSVHAAEATLRNAIVKTGDVPVPIDRSAPRVWEHATMPSHHSHLCTSDIDLLSRAPAEPNKANKKVKVFHDTTSSRPPSSCETGFAMRDPGCVGYRLSDLSTATVEIFALDSLQPTWNDELVTEMMRRGMLPPIVRVTGSMRKEMCTFFYCDVRAPTGREVKDVLVPDQTMWCFYSFLLAPTEPIVENEC